MALGGCLELADVMHSVIRVSVFMLSIIVLSGVILSVCMLNIIVLLRSVSVC